MNADNFSRPGAVDLSSLAQPRGQQPGPPAPGPGPGGSATGSPGAFVVDVDETTFQSLVLEQSSQVPVVLALWSPSDAPSSQLVGLLGQVVAGYGGRILLARLDVEANPRLAAAVGAQGVPMVLGVLLGQVVAPLEGRVSEPQVRQYLDQLIAAAQANGVTGTASPGTAGQAAAPAAGPPADQPTRDPRYAGAEDALDRGDLDGAVAAYEQVLTQHPGDAVATQGLAAARLMQRVRGADPGAVRAAAADRPDDVDSQIAAADQDLVGGHVEDALNRLVGLVARVFGDERNRTREHLVDLFTVLGNNDSRVRSARQRLASALF